MSERLRSLLKRYGGTDGVKVCIWGKNVKTVSERVYLNEMRYRCQDDEERSSGVSSQTRARLRYCIGPGVEWNLASSGFSGCARSSLHERSVHIVNLVEAWTVLLLLSTRGSGTDAMYCMIVRWKGRQATPSAEGHHECSVDTYVETVQDDILSQSPNRRQANRYRGC